MKEAKASRRSRMTVSTSGVALAVLLAGCAAGTTSGRNILVLPGPGKSHTAFQQDDYTCRAAASRNIGYGEAAQAGNNTIARSAATGAAAGTTEGAVFGNVVVAAAEQESEANLQRRYDTAYAQCMTAKGNKVPSGRPVPVIAPDDYLYSPYPPLYAYYPGYGYLYPPLSMLAAGGWNPADPPPATPPDGGTPRGGKN